MWGLLFLNNCILNRHIYENRLALCNPGNTEPCHIDNPGKIRILTYLKRGTYSEPSEIFNNERFARIVKPIKYQCCPHIETSQLICCANQLTGFYMSATLTLNGLKAIIIFPKCSILDHWQGSLLIRPFLNKYSLNCRVTLPYVLYEPYSEPCL